MKMKRIMSVAVLLIFAFVSAFAYTGESTVASAAANGVNLPATTGLYRSSWIDYNWEMEPASVRTDVDDKGNTVLVDGAGNFIDYQFSNDSNVFTEGVKDGWGPSFNAAGDELWFDYIEDGNKITHVNPSDLTITNLDGTSNSSVTIGKHWTGDERILNIRSNSMEPVLITYNGASVNNKLVLVPSLYSGLYTSPEPAIDNFIDGWNVYKEGTTTAYLHLFDSNWEFGRYIADAQTLINSMIYYNPATDSEINNDDYSKYFTVKPWSVSNPNHLIFKINAKYIPNSDGWCDLGIRYRTYDVNDGEASGWDDELHINVNFIDGKAPVPAVGSTDTIGGIVYSVTGADSATVSKGKNAASVTIPASVTIDGYSFKVTSVAADAFKGCTKIKTLTIKTNNLKSAGKNAFSGIKKSAKAKVPKKKKSAYKKLLKKGGFKGKIKV